MSWSNSPLVNQANVDKFPNSSQKVRAASDRSTDTLEAGTEANIENNPAFDLIGLTSLRQDPQFAGIDGTNFSVAIIDTGIDREHPLLAPNYVAGYDFVDNDDNPEDPQGHGTHVAGTIGATATNVGVAPDAGLIGLRVLDGGGAGALTNVEESLEWVLANRDRYNITAINLSLGIGHFGLDSGPQGDILSDDIRRLEAAGVTVIGATGNNYIANSDQVNQSNISFPAIASTLAVGAVWQDDVNSDVSWQAGSTDYTTGADRIASFSQRLDAPNVVFAPGAIITSTVPGGGLGDNGGTSQASPHVAGLVALMQEASMEFGGRSLTPDEVREILRTTGDAIVDGDDEDDNVTNTSATYIRINAYSAVAEVKRRSESASNPVDNSDNSGTEDTDATDINATDSDGTIAGAVVVPDLDSADINVVMGRIGADGATRRDNDVDLYRFELLSPGTVGLEVKADPSNKEDFDSYLRLFDAEGKQIALNDDLSEGNNFSRLDVNLQPGTYYVGVSGYKNLGYDPTVAGSGVDGATGNYSLQLSLSDRDPDGIISGAKSVNLGNDPEPLAFAGNIGQDQERKIGNADVDLFRIVAPDNGTLLIDIDTPYADNFVDSQLRIFDRDGNELVFAENEQAAANDDGLAFDMAGQQVEVVSTEDPKIVLDREEETELKSGGVDANGNYQQGNYGHNTDSFTGVRVKRGETYYVGVSDFANNSYSSSNLSNRNDAGAGGNYELIASFANDDIDGSIAQAQAITNLPIDNRSEVIGKDGDRDVGDRDVDFYRFNSHTAGILDLRVTSGADPVNTVTAIFDSQGRRLGVNDGLNSHDSRLRYQVAANTDYYVAVTGFGNQNFDPSALGSGAGGDTGTYTINGSLMPSTAGDSLSDNKLDSSGVQTIAGGETLLGNIGNDSGVIVGNSDVDLYRYVADTDKTVSISTIVNEELSADTYLRVFDYQGKEIAANNDASDRDRGSSIQLNVRAGETYYLGVNGNSSQAREYNAVTGIGAAAGSSGNYNLRVSSDGDLVSGSKVHRFYRPDLGVHFYTSSTVERDTIIDSVPQFSYEGESFVAAANADSLTGTKPVHRFLNTDMGTHLYTIAEGERDFINSNLSNYTYEGVAYHGYESDRPGATPLYRFYNPTLNSHFYTPSGAEKDFVVANLPDYQLEGNGGVAFYVEPLGEV